MSFVYAQTNLQLISQMLSKGYTTAEVESVTRAYALVTELHVAMFRSNGKPFSAHVIGTASILAARQYPVVTIRAAMLHAAYLLGRFGDAGMGATQPRRQKVRDVIGAESEALVFDYWQLPWGETGTAKVLETITGLTERERQIVAMRLADELDDFLDGGMQISPLQLKRKGEGLGLTGLAGELQAASNQAYTTPLPAELCSPHEVSYSVTPKPNKRSWLTLGRRFLESALHWLRKAK
jgi:hypothetical protein